MKPAIILTAIAGLAAGALLYIRTQPDETPAPVKAATAMPAATVTSKPYPFATSVVSGEKLPATGTVKFVQDGYEVQVANAAEAETFKKNPALYVAKIRDAYKNAKPCPYTVCPVMHDPIDKDAYVFVYEGREFKMCCDGCLDDFQKDPAKFVKIWDDAAQTGQK